MPNTFTRAWARVVENFDAYWSAVDAELARYPSAPELERIPLRCTDFADVYAARFTSLGPYRLFGYLSVPTVGGPHPALLELPRYGSVNHVPAYELRQRYVVLALMHRGQRLADRPFAAAYPGLLTSNIECPATYIYRAIVADCLRGAEVLLENPHVDSDRVAVVGDDLALLTAARRPHMFAAVQASGLLFYRALEACTRTSAYPIEEISDALRHARTDVPEAIAATLALFDPVHHAASIAAPTLLAAGDAGALGGTDWLAPLLKRLGARGALYQLTHEGRTDHTALGDWLARHLQ